MPLLTYAGLSASPKRRNDGRTCNHMATGNDTSKQTEKRVTSTSHDSSEDGRIKRLSRSKEQNIQVPTFSKTAQDNHSKAPYQLSNNTAMRLYNSSHPHRENHQRLSSRRQAPYASAPSSPWKSGCSSNSSSTYLCPTAATQARQNGLLSRSQIIQREDILSSDPSLSIMSRSTNGSLIISNGHGKPVTKYDRSYSANSDQRSSNIAQPHGSLSRSHEEQSPRLNHRVLELGGTISPKHQWLASGPNGIKLPNAVANRGPTSRSSNYQPNSSSARLSQSTVVNSSGLSSSTKRKSGSFLNGENSQNGTNTNQVSKPNRNVGKSGSTYTNSKPLACNINERNKRRSFGSAPPCSSSMSKSDSVAYKSASKTLRCPVKHTTSKLEEENLAKNSTNCSLPFTSHSTSSSLTASTGSSTLISSSLLSKVRYRLYQISIYECLCLKREWLYIFQYCIQNSTIICHNAFEYFQGFSFSLCEILYQDTISNKELNL